MGELYSNPLVAKRMQLNFPDKSNNIEFIYTK